MATLAQLEAGLKRAYEAGNMEYARLLGAEIVRARSDVGNLIPGSQVASTAPQQETGVLDKLAGAGETALTLATGATGGLVGAVGGAVKGLATEILSGRFGTREAANAVEQAASQGAQALTYQPRTQAGQEMTADVGQFLGNAIPPVIAPAMAPGMGMQAAAQAARAVAPMVRPVATAAAQAVGGAAKQAGGAVASPVKSVASKITGFAAPEVIADTTTGTGSAVSRGSVGAAGVSEALERRTRAEMMPVPFQGKSSLTAGQASRDYSQLQFEKETAKMGDMGAPLRERVQNQTATFIQNFDALIDMSQPVASDARSIGSAVDKALVNRVEVMRRKVRDAYTKAREDGAMSAPVEMAPLAARLDELSRYEGVSPNIGAIKKEAIRLGAITPDSNGVLSPSKITVDNAELLRQFVNESTDWMDRRQSLFARRINDSIDSATENAGGASYKAARKLRKQLADEFETVGLTKKLTSSKRGTDERQIAFEDVFDKVIVSSPVEEMNKLRATLLRSGRDGQQAWADMKAMGIQRIKEASLSPSQRDAAGNPLLSPDKLQRTVKAMDESGKLVSLYGKKNAQILRDLADISTDIYTAPPGAINTSNTASALMMAMDMVGTATLTGLPAPAVTAIREASKYAKNRKVKLRIDAALAGKMTKE